MVQSTALLLFLGAQSVIHFPMATNEGIGTALAASKPYVPVDGQCPSTIPSIRDASSGLLSDEKAFIQSRRQAAIPAMQKFFSGLNISGFDAGGYIKSQSSNIANLPNIGLALSGGGYRAMLNGAGAIKAFDSRESSSALLGGLLQSSTYTAGLSGGSWLLSTVFFNNFSTISNLQTPNGPVWNLTSSLFDPVSGGASIEAFASLYEGIFAEVSGRGNAGFATSIVDYWGRLLSQRFFNAQDYGVGYTWSGIANAGGFSSGSVPFLIVNAESRVNKQLSWTPSNTTVYEFTPFEFGSWDASVAGFAPTRYIGSNFTNGQIKDQNCVTGYDQAGFVFGASSALFSKSLTSAITQLVPQALLKELGPLITSLEEDNGLVAQIGPNPFNGWKASNAASAGLNTDTLSLVDGGTDGQAIPLQPLVQPARGIDVIVAVDGTSDINSYPNGTALLAAYAHSQSAIGNNLPFPAIPGTNTFVNLGLNNKPTFFGCTNTTAPLIVYIPNAPYTSQSNTSTYKFTYTYQERDDLIANAALAATQGNGTAGNEFRACMGCALLARSFTRTNTAVPAACQKCFSAYCWNGTLASTAPSQPYAPTPFGASPSGAGLGVVGSSSSNSSATTSSSSPTSTSSSSPSSSTTPSKGAGSRTSTAAVMAGLPLLAMIMSLL